MKKGLFLSTFLGVFLAAGSVSAFETPAKNAFLMDAEKGYVMYNKDGDIPMPPASMSKLMTAYMLFEQLKNGKISLDDEYIVSENAWRKGGAKSGSSTMFLNPNERVKVRDLLRGIIVQSGNDACIVVAENMAGSEDVFASLMTKKAKEIGLTNSTFKNATGLPDPEHRMSARDLAVLAQRLINDFPEYYSIYSEKTFTHNGIKQGNRNPLLYDVPGADGLKTGHTEASGYGLTGSVKDANGRRVIMVINGLKSMKERSTESQRIVGWGLSAFENVKLFDKNQKVADIPVWLGVDKTVPGVIDADMLITVPKTRSGAINAELTYDTPVVAPIKVGQKLGTVTVTLPEHGTLTADVLAGGNVEKVGYFGKLTQVVLSFFGK